MYDVIWPTAANWWHHLSDVEREQYMNWHRDILELQRQLKFARQMKHEIMSSGERRCRESLSHLHDMRGVLPEPLLED